MVSNFDLSPTAEGSERLWRQTGIRTRRYALAEEAASDLAAQALTPALTPEVRSHLRALVLATTSPDYPSPATAAYVHAALDLSSSTLAFDVASSCTSFLSGLLAALGLVESGGQVALVASEVKHKSLGDDERMRALFADGAAALILGRGDGREGFLPTFARVDHALAHHIQIPVGGSRAPVSLSNLADARLRMVEPRMVFRHTVKAFHDAIMACWEARAEACARLGLASSAVPGFVYCHQANANILREVRDRLPDEVARRMPILMEDVGNMVCASLPVARTRLRLLERLWLPEGFRSPTSIDGLVVDTREEAESLRVEDRAGGFFLERLGRETRDDLHACLRAGQGDGPIAPSLAQPGASRPRIDAWVAAGGGFQTLGVLHARNVPLPNNLGISGRGNAP
jgi:3-oxoacyl-[acyl-carrier-protein] synthase-3